MALYDVSLLAWNKKSHTVLLCTVDYAVILFSTWSIGLKSWISVMSKTLCWCLSRFHINCLFADSLCRWWHRRRHHFPSSSLIWSWERRRCLDQNEHRPYILKIKTNKFRLMLFASSDILQKLQKSRSEEFHFGDSLMCKSTLNSLPDLCKSNTPSNQVPSFRVFWCLFNPPLPHLPFLRFISIPPCMGSISPHVPPSPQK